MKFLKTALHYVTFALALLTVIITIMAVMCKFQVFPKNIILQACGYITYYWVLIFSAIILILLLLSGFRRIAIAYLIYTALLSPVLSDYSFRSVTVRKPENSEDYDSIKILALNVKYYYFGIEKIISLIRKNDYDLVLLSESVLTKMRLQDMKTSLSDYTLITDDGHDLSLLSKYPVSFFKIVKLPTYQASLSGSNDIDKIGSDGIHRSFIHAVISLNGTNINVLSLRLIAGRPKDHSIYENIRWGKYLIAAQNEELSVFLDYLRLLKGPVIFGGDLNVTSNSGILQEIKKYADDSYLDNHLFGSITFGNSIKKKRIDYLFHSKDLISANSEVLNIKVSDHYPIFAKFLIKRSYADRSK